MLSKTFIIFGLCILLATTCIAKETQVIAGAGPSTKVVKLFFENFASNPAAHNYEFIVPPESVKHAGGIKNSYKYLFGRTGRPLNEKERAYKRNEIFLASMPIVIASGREVKVSQLSMRELEMIFQKKITNWKKVGGPDAEILTVGREPTEALFSELKRYYTFFRRSKFDMVLNKDHEVVNFLESPLGWYAISFGAKANLSHLNEILIKEDLQTGVRLGLVYGREHADHPLVKAAENYAKSPEWKDLVRATGAYPVNQ